MATIEGLEKVSAAIKRLIGKYPERTSVVVGCCQRYALFVHEDMNARHNTGQAKFLETPARRYAKDLADVVIKAVKRGASVTQGLILAGLQLQREAQLLTPVDTSALKSSFFTVVEEELEAKSSEMFAVSEATRQVVSAKHAKMSEKQLGALKARQRSAWLNRMGRRG